MVQHFSPDIQKSDKLSGLRIVKVPQFENQSSKSPVFEGLASDPRCTRKSGFYQFWIRGDVQSVFVVDAHSMGMIFVVAIPRRPLNADAKHCHLQN